MAARTALNIVSLTIHTCPTRSSGSDAATLRERAALPTPRQPHAVPLKVHAGTTSEYAGSCRIVAVFHFDEYQNRTMSATQPPANKVLLRPLNREHGDSARPEEPPYEVYLAKFHKEKGKYFYCNLLTKTTSWEAPQGAVEEASADGKSADDLWKEISVAFEDARLAQVALQKAQSDSLAARQKQVALLESLRPPGAASSASVEPQGAVRAPPKQDSGKAANKPKVAKLPECAAAEAPNPSVAAAPSAPPAAAAGGGVAATPQKHPKVHVNWTQHKPVPDPAITSAQVQEALAQFGAINLAFVVKDSLAKKSLPFGFVDFKSADAAGKAVAAKTVTIGTVVAKLSYAKGP
jgi:hypothetical protein